MEEFALHWELGTSQFITRDCRAGQLDEKTDGIAKFGWMGGEEAWERACELADSFREAVAGETKPPGKLGSAHSNHLSVHSCNHSSGYHQFALKELELATAWHLLPMPWEGLLQTRLRCVYNARY